MLKLFRDTSSATATTGFFDLQPHRIFTLERPWVPASIFATDNLRIPCGRKGVSCVPPGRYKLVPHNSEAHPHTVALVNPSLWVYHFEEDVPTSQRGWARTTVLIHPANFVSELRGCIAPGWTRVGETVRDSRRAFAQLSLNWPDEIEIVSLVGAV
jgi:hypothetical protein